MQLDKALNQINLSQDMIDVMIRVGLIAFLVVMCVKIFSPFMGLMLWALIIAVTLYPLHQKLAVKLGGRQGRAASLLVLLCILLIGVPTVMLIGSAADYVHQTHEAFQNKTFGIQPPPPEVADWPVVGKKIHEVWSMAATNLPSLLEKIRPQLEAISKSALGLAAGAASGILQFLAALIISGIMMAYGQSGSEAMLRIIHRLAGPKKGEQLHKLSTATIRSVSMGVLGVAFLQALLLGIGFIWANIPGAGLLAIVVLVLGIAQLPATLITIPVIAYLWWSGDSTLSNVFFTVYLVIAGLADNVLKPLLLGRGVDAPMPVVLLGALGGMVSAGLIGLFVGAVLLSLGYILFMDWVGDGEAKDSGQAAEDASETVPAGE